MSTTDKLNGFGPLAGVKVVELCEWVAAPAAVRCLSEMGATVIKTEPLHGDAASTCLIYKSPSPRDMRRSSMPSSA